MSPLPVSVFVLCLAVDSISGHGMLMEPINRSSMYRVNPNAPINFDDDQNYCGGRTVQWVDFDGKCGVCGDPYNDPHPQDNENTGKYGKGVIAKEYTAGSVIDIKVTLGNNRMGHFNFSVCVLEDPSVPESGEDCFVPITMGDGSPTYVLPNKEEIVYDKITTTVKLPDGLTCERCVLRWTYTTADHRGDCGDGTKDIGCGPQETFRSCSDIAIH